MGFITTKDGTQIFYKDWGRKDAQPIVFHHGWPLSADDWDAQLIYFLNQGFRVVGQKAIEQALEQPDTTTYKRLAKAVSADLIIDGGFTRDKKSAKKKLSARLVSAISGDVLATTRVQKPDKQPFVTGQKVCADLLQQLP